MSLKVQAIQEALFKLQLRDSDLYDISAGDYTVSLQGEYNLELVSMLEKKGFTAELQEATGYTRIETSVVVEYPDNYLPNSTLERRFKVRLTLTPGGQK